MPQDDMAVQRQITWAAGDVGATASSKLRARVLSASLDSI